MWWMTLRGPGPKAWCLFIHAEASLSLVDDVASNMCLAAPGRPCAPYRGEGPARGPGGRSVGRAGGSCAAHHVFTCWRLTQHSVTRVQAGQGDSLMPPSSINTRRRLPLTPGFDTRVVTRRGDISTPRFELSVWFGIEGRHSIATNQNVFFCTKHKINHNHVVCALNAF